MADEEARVYAPLFEKVLNDGLPIWWGVFLRADDVATLTAMLCDMTATTGKLWRGGDGRRPRAWQNKVDVDVNGEDNDGLTLEFLAISLAYAIPTHWDSSNSRDQLFALTRMPRPIDTHSGDEQAGVIVNHHALFPAFFGLTAFWMLVGQCLWDRDNEARLFQEGCRAQYSTMLATSGTAVREFLGDDAGEHIGDEWLQAFADATAGAVRRAFDDMPPGCDAAGYAAEAAAAMKRGGVSVRARRCDAIEENDDPESTVDARMGLWRGYAGAEVLFFSEAEAGVGAGAERVVGLESLRGLRDAADGAAAPLEVEVAKADRKSVV